MGKGGSSSSSADTIYRTDVTTTTKVGDIGIMGPDLVKIVDLIETANVARDVLRPVSNGQFQPYTSFVPAPQTPQPVTTLSAQGPDWTILAIVGAGALGLALIARR